MAMVNYVAPWIDHYRKIEALFKGDDDIHVVYDNEAVAVNLYVEDPVKAEALEKLMKYEIQFGNITLTVNIYPGNRAKNILALRGDKKEYLESDPENYLDILKAAFAGNECLADVVLDYGLAGMEYTYVIFEPVIVQYYTDDISDIYRCETTVYEDLARAVMKEIPGVFYCTAIYEDQLQEYKKLANHYARKSVN